MSRGAVFSQVGKPLTLTPFKVPQEPEPHAVICRVKLATICGSDLHTISGRREEPTPLILGHEILGEIVAIGPGLTEDGFGQPVHVGDRVTWTIMANCGHCFYCLHGLPNKCSHLHKYGHTCCNDVPPLTGGFAEHVVLWPGTTLFRVPEALPDEIATPANCALATVVCAREAIDVRANDTVLIQGAGLLGLNLIALCREAGASRIFVTDVSASRLALAQRFGADACFDLSGTNEGDVIAAIHHATHDRGVDAAFEVCGQADAAPLGLKALRIGGRYLIAGLVTPGSEFQLDGNMVTRRCLTIRGIHNYAPRHLGEGLEFLDASWKKHPYEEIVQKTFSLDQINEAVAEAATGEHIRVAVRP